MRGTRWLLLLAILAILAGIGVTYQTQQKVLATHAPPKPAALPVKMDSLRHGFETERTEAGRKKYSIVATTVSQEKDSSHVKIENVELRLFDKDQDTYNLVKSATADYDQDASRMYSEGEVQMTLHVPVEGQPTRPLVQIRSSGVTFDTKAGQEFVSTDRETHFTFENGTGQCVGATYDPSKRELHLKDHGEIDWKAPTPHAPAVKIEAGDVIYKEVDGTVWLNNGARLTRQNMVVNAAWGVVHLQDQTIRQVDAVKAQGTDEYPKRKLEYSADEVQLVYNDQGEIEHICGRHNAHLHSRSDGSETTMDSDVVDLELATVNGESVLKRALGNGHATILSKPLTPGSDGKLPETHVIHSDTIEVKMREGGREVASVETQAPGTLDFLPNQPAQRQRRLEAERMAMTYGPNNELESFRAVKIRTETQPNAEERAKKQPVSHTRSENLSATFDPKSGQMKHMEQWGGFEYEAGDRRATAGRATLEQDSNLMSLETRARVWDATGATSADRILIDQKTGDFTAEGHVSSSRLPDKKTSPSGMLAGDEPVEAMADRMTSANHNHLVHYENHVMMWQGADRISADRTDVDRDKRTVAANGNVVTQFREKAKADAASAGSAAPIFVVVKAASLVYTDQDRLAHYTGGVVLTRPQMQVKADELRATLAPQDNDKSNGTGEKKDEDQSRLEKAYADGHVEIVQTGTDRTRTGTSDHAEYFTDPENEHIVLRGGTPQMVDSKKGFTRGAELTYYVNDDRLLVSGSPEQPATGRLRRKQ